MSGLVVYLAGPGRAEEHESPHLVAGDAMAMSWYSHGDLDHGDALALGRYLDAPTREHEASVDAGHVWHCPLSIGADEGQLSDAQWEEIATEFVARMGFDGPHPDGPDGTAEGGEETAPGCRWIAVRHGASKAGNDHIHLAVNLIRSDGSVADVHQDWRRAMAACRELEHKHGLVELESIPGRGPGERGWSRGEVEASARRHAQDRYELERGRVSGPSREWAELSVEDRTRRVEASKGVPAPRRQLEVQVRAAGTAARDEAEFVRRLRDDGLLVRPRFAKGTADVVEGYSVAAASSGGETIWYGGGRLARDLTLPRLREQWPGDVAAVQAGADEWRAGASQRPAVRTDGREHKAIPQDKAWPALTRELHRLQAGAAQIPIGDDVAWSAFARDAAGVLSAWSKRHDSPELAEAARVVGRSAYRPGGGGSPGDVKRVTATGAAAMLAASRGVGVASEFVAMKQMMLALRALADAHRAAGRAREAVAIRDRAMTRLQSVATDTRSWDERHRDQPRLIALRDPARPPTPTVTATSARPTGRSPNAAQRGTEHER